MRKKPKQTFFPKTIEMSIAEVIKNKQKDAIIAENTKKYHDDLLSSSTEWSIDELSRRVDDIVKERHTPKMTDYDATLDMFRKVSIFLSEGETSDFMYLKKVLPSLSHNALCLYYKKNPVLKYEFDNDGNLTYVFNCSEINPSPFNEHNEKYMFESAFNHKSINKQIRFEVLGRELYIDYKDIFKSFLSDGFRRNFMNFAEKGNI